MRNVCNLENENDNLAMVLFSFHFKYGFRAGSRWICRGGNLEQGKQLATSSLVIAAYYVFV